MTVFVDYIEPLCALERRRGGISWKAARMFLMYAILAAHNIGARVYGSVLPHYFSLLRTCAARSFRDISRHFARPRALVIELSSSLFIVRRD